MTWIAAHQAPGGMLARFTHSSREAAALALYSALSNIRGGREARQRLVASAPGTHFIAEIDGHWFSLSALGADSAPVVGCALAGNSSPSPEALLDPANSSAGGAVFQTSPPAFFSNPSVDTSMVQSLPCPNSYGAGK